MRGPGPAHGLVDFVRIGYLPAIAVLSLHGRFGPAAIFIVFLAWKGRL